MRKWQASSALFVPFCTSVSDALKSLNLKRPDAQRVAIMHAVMQSADEPGQPLRLIFTRTISVHAIGAHCFSPSDLFH